MALCTIKIRIFYGGQWEKNPVPRNRNRYSHSWCIYWVGCTGIQRPLKKLKLNGFEQLCSTLLIKTRD